MQGNGTATTPAVATARDVYVLRLDPFDPQTGMLWPFVCQRVIGFAREHEGTEAMARKTLAEITVGNPEAFAAVAVKASGQVVGHVLGYIDRSGPAPIPFVLQVQNDSGHADVIAEQGLPMFRAWKAALGFKDDRIQGVCDPDRARYFERKFGFEVLRCVIREKAA